MSNYDYFRGDTSTTIDNAFAALRHIIISNY
jgi:hypothetical protein